MNMQIKKIVKNFLPAILFDYFNYLKINKILWKDFILSLCKSFLSNNKNYIIFNNEPWHHTTSYKKRKAFYSKELEKKYILIHYDHTSFLMNFILRCFIFNETNYTAQKKKI